ncbi:hypothetical protein ACPOL_7112 (plasmid) [Acidisarcina polymorpha]|uniref:Uncharacterized protein n=2 Tax=Acidisarcina polymorpha TaxID=2211140 RepID=A0A2Z5GC52_9BACT|nr:hypothetical protein ACPOL_7112 [Acidisarcina polymorpha]
MWIPLPKPLVKAFLFDGRIPAYQDEIKVLRFKQFQGGVIRINGCHLIAGVVKQRHSSGLEGWVMSNDENALGQGSPL